MRAPQGVPGDGNDFGNGATRLGKHRDGGATNVVEVKFNDACPYRKSNPDVLMMQSSQERLGDDAANGLDRPRNRCILAQR